MVSIVRRHVFQVVAVVSMLIPLASANADPVEIRLPLREGRISTASLTDTLWHRLRLSVFRHMPAGEINLRGLSGNLFVAGMNSALGDGCQLEVESDALILRVDPDKLPRSMDEVKAALRTFTTVASPQASAAQAKRWGLTLPEAVDPTKPLVILVHGLDSDDRDWQSIGSLLDNAGYQTARFDYPADGPITEDVDRFSREMRPLHDRYPTMPIEIVAYSMGSLISRGYVEGPDYAGGVTRLIMIAPPNHGSTWAVLEPVAKASYEWNLAMFEPSWSPSWMITSGLGEAGRDLEPGSNFLSELNSRPRRAGVRYTIIEGNENPIQRIEANWLAASVNKLPKEIESIPGMWLVKIRLLSEADALRDRPANDDGPVSLASAHLPGVTDVVTLHADHAALCLAHGDNPPAAWEAVHARLTE